jgi:hypothetical protein
MGKLRELSERLWQGDGPNHVNPLFGPVGLPLEEYGAGLGFLASFGNVTALDTADGLVLIDTGSALSALRAPLVGRDQPDGTGHLHGGGDGVMV